VRLKVACRVQIPNSFPQQAVSGEVAPHLFLAVKEALNNAVRHGGASEIRFGVRVLEDRLQISINDNGSGFDTFGRSNGHGLLNLRNRLEHLHGRCELKSSPGAGTTVSLELPLPVPNNTMNTVAIVEDNAVMRNTFRRWIDAAPGYRCVFACANAEEALAEIPRLKPDVVLMDVHLPGESGIACTAQLKEKAARGSSHHRDGLFATRS